MNLVNPAVRGGGGGRVYDESLLLVTKWHESQCLAGIRDERNST